MTAKDVALMVRMGLPEAEIFAEVEKRRLAAPLDAAGETALTASGATPALIARLKTGSYALSSDAAEKAARDSAIKRVAFERQQALDTAAFEERQRKLYGLNAPRPPGVASDRMRSLLDGKLVKLRGDEIVPADAGELKHTRLYLLYQSAQWCGPCREFTPKLVAFYHRVKATHPELEVIFLSSDRDEFNMANYMRSSGMPWPAVRYGAGSQIEQLYCGKGVPWLVVVDDAGKPLTQNGIDKKYLDPNALLAAVETKLQPPRK